VDDLLRKYGIVHDFPSFHVARFFFGDNIRKNWFGTHGYDLCDDFVDDITKSNRFVLFGVRDPLFLWDESEEGGIKG